MSQGIKRDAWGKLPTVCRRSTVFSYEGGFTLTGFDHIKALGFGDRLAYGSSLSDAQARDLAGEAFAVPCISVVIQSIFCNKYAPWWATAAA